MAKLENGFQTCSLTDAAVTFGIVTGGLPKIEGGEPPDTTTNSNVKYMSVGTSQYMKIEPFTIEAAFEPEHYISVVNWLNKLDTLESVLVDGTQVSIPVKPKSYEPTGFEVDGFPTATIEFTPDTGVDGSTGITTTITP